MKEIGPQILQWIPFVGLAVGKEGSTHPVITRLIEAAIIGGVVTWGTVKVLSNDIDWIKSSIQQTNTRIDRLEAFIYSKR